MVPSYLNSAIEQGWQVTRLDKLITSKIIIGHLDGNHGNLYPRSSEFVDSGVKYISANALIDGKADLSKAKYLTAERGAQFKKGVAKNGDVLFAHNATVGPVALLNTDDDYVILSTSLTYYRCDLTKINNHYLVQYMSSPAFVRQYEKIMKQTTRNQIPITAQRDFYFVLPPLPEQRKIAKILSTWDKAIATNEKLIETSKQQKKALMQQLLTGKKRLVNPETGKAFDGDWGEVHIGDICSVKGGKRLPKGESLQNVPNNHPYIRVADMFMGGVDSSNILYVPEHIAPSISRYTIKSEDLFITVAGTLGLVGKVPPQLDGANLTENADKLTDIKCNQTFLMYVLMSPVIQKHIEAESTQNAQPKLALSRIRGFKLLVPEKSEQQKIASVLTAADKEIEVLEAKLAHFKQEKKALMQQLLTGKRRVKVDEVA